MTEPWIIPNYGCCSINDRGSRCEGDSRIDMDKYCKNCNCFSPKILENNCFSHKITIFHEKRGKNENKLCSFVS